MTIAELQTRITEIETSLSSNDPTVASITTDGLTVRYDRDKAREELRELRGRLARKTRRPIMSRTRLGGAR